MGYTRASSVVRFGAMALIAVQLSGCASAREVTRGAGTAIGVMGALALLVAIDPDCDPDTDYECETDEPYYEEETLETRAIIAASGGAAVLIGGGLVAAASVPPKRKRRPAPYTPPPAPPVSVPSTQSRALRELIEKRCVPQGGIDLRVAAEPDEPRASLPACEVSGPSAPAPNALVAPGSPAPQAR